MECTHSTHTHIPRYRYIVCVYLFILKKRTTSVDDDNAQAMSVPAVPTA